MSNYFEEQRAIEKYLAEQLSLWTDQAVKNSIGNAKSLASHGVEVGFGHGVAHAQMLMQKKLEAVLEKAGLIPVRWDDEEDGGD